MKFVRIIALILAAGILSWWLVVILVPESRGLFFSNPQNETELILYGLADGVLNIPGLLLISSKSVHDLRKVRLTTALCFINFGITVMLIFGGVETGLGKWGSLMMSGYTLVLAGLVLFLKFKKNEKVL